MNTRMTPRKANTEISAQVEAWLKQGNTVTTCAPVVAKGAEVKRETRAQARKLRSEIKWQKVLDI